MIPWMVHCYFTHNFENIPVFKIEYVIYVKIVIKDMLILCLLAKSTKVVLKLIDINH